MQQTRRRSATPPRPDPWRRIDAERSWDDLVLPDAALAQLRSIPALVSERYWTGSGAPHGDARRGVVLLFAGGTGTGKTMAAQVLAAEMGLPILSADLEAVYAGGRGEAARLMARLFANAQRLGAVVELDQADFILSSAVASERPLSIRVADADLRDLLERCETHPGVVVFPTTRTREIDAAVRGSAEATIEFPFPETPDRAAIWRHSLAPGAAVSLAEIDDLARSFKLPGQAIATSCAAAGQAARSEGVPVGLAHLARALEQEYATRLVSDTTRAALERLHGRPGVPGPAALGVHQFGGNGTRTAIGAAVEPEPVARAPVPEPEPVAQAPEPAPEVEPVAEAPAPAPDPPVADSQPAPALATPAEAEPVRPEETTFAAALHAAQAPSASHDDARPSDPVASPALGPQAGDALAPPAHPPQAAAPEPPEFGDAAIDDAAADNLVRAMASSAAATATTATATAPSATAPRRRRRWVTAARRLIPIALIGIISAVVLGFVASNQRKPAATRAIADQVARTRDVSFRYPGAWQLQRAPTIRGLSLRDAVAVSSSASPAGRLVIGIAPAQSDNPLPERFIAAAITGTPAQQLVTLGKHQFFRVIDPRLTLGASSQSVYALSAVPRPVIAVCQTASQAFAASCERALSTLQLNARASAPAARTARAASAAPAQPNRAYASALGAILSRLNRDRSAAAHDLAVARTSKVEAKAAGLLAGLHAQASGEIAGLRAGSAAAANAGLAAALRNLANAYGTLGRGALHNDPHGYRVGLSDITKTSSALSAALAKLAALGYAVR
ncbi:MAG: hypothetical protein QOG59_952 [Solirubrobacteraceae bacterium]|jgi:hypothetical protein|nr:hypothetical protein [Solirubrobacteraceae bacterium]